MDVVKDEQTVIVCFRQALFEVFQGGFLQVMSVDEDKVKLIGPYATIQVVGFGSSPG
jgi:hypothetical protein